MNLKQFWSVIRGRRTNYRFAGMSMTSTPELTAAQRAYGLLWQEISDRPRVHEARRTLLAAMTKDEQRDAIAWVKQHHPLTEREILEKSP